MKKYYFLIITTLLLGLIFATFNVRAQDLLKEGEEATGFSINPNMSLKIALAKTEFVQLEPISMLVSVINETDSPQTTIRPAILNEGTLTVNSDGELKQYNDLTIFRILLVRQPVTFQPGQGFGEDIIFEKSLDKFFPNPL